MLRFCFLALPVPLPDDWSMIGSIFHLLKTGLQTLRSLFQTRKELALAHLALRQLELWNPGSVLD